ncbi:hypothetical protein ACFQE5_12315 [Pseudonocardia hispaniensis]|uniref:Uncharacterized protein n=1 Tax=Pseudonocardia hispaniensis TaxID=904933 RepID=A0ABW1J3K2_9PSEU
MDHEPIEESAEDYGYDLAHEAAPAPPDAAEEHPPNHRAAAAEHEVDPGSDYSYDEAHDFRGGAAPAG